MTRAAFAALSAVVGALTLFDAPARAAVTHEYLPAVSAKLSEGVPAGSGAALTGPLNRTFGMAVDSGHLFFADKPTVFERYRVDRFSASSGEFESQIAHSLAQSGESQFRHGVAVGHGDATVYVGGQLQATGTSGVVDAFSETGSLLKAWTGADTPFESFGRMGVEGVAVDNNPSSLADWAAGDVYVADDHRGPEGPEVEVVPAVEVFRPKPEGGEEYLTQLLGTEPGTPFVNLTGVAVDPLNGDVVVADKGNYNFATHKGRRTAVDVFEPVAGMEKVYRFRFAITGPSSGSPFPGGVNGVAVDGHNGDIYTWFEGTVYQFNSEGAFLGSITGTPETPFIGVFGIAVDPVSEDVYVSYAGKNAHDEEVYPAGVFGPNRVIPDVTTGPTSSVGPERATLNGTVNPDNAGPATCQFLWGTSRALGEVKPCPHEIGQGSSPVAVEAKLEGLQPDTTYYYRLQATNANGTNPGLGSQVQEFTTLGPGIEESASNVAGTSATLDATINPHKSRTFCYFQYGRTTGYEEAPVPAPPGVFIGAGEGGVEVSRHLQGLANGTVYHYRVVVVNEVEPEAHPGVFTTFYGPDRTLTTQSPGEFALPDGRRWEMVSPPDKHGALILPVDHAEGGETQAAVDGDAISYLANAPTEGEPVGYTNHIQVLSTRGPGGWESRNVAPPHAAATALAVGDGQEYRLFSEDLSLAVVQPFGHFDPAISAEASEQTAFLHTDFSGGVGDRCVSSCYRPLVTGAPGYANVRSGAVFGVSGLFEKGAEVPCPPDPICGPEFVGATPDLSHIVLSSHVGLTPSGAAGLYEWTHGVLVPVSVVGNEPVGGGLGGGSEQDVRNAISNDGSRVFWTGGVDNSLYLRDTARGKTLRLDAVQGGSGYGSAVPVFQTASSDGSKVFFTDEQRLTAGSGAAGGKPDLYECEIVEEGGEPHCVLSDLTPSNTGEEAGVLGAVLGASGDGSWVYFVADGRLAADAVSGTCGGSGNPATLACNLYVRHDGVTRLVAVLSGEDLQDWGGGGHNLTALTARVSPDGEWLAFMSDRELTGYVTRDALTGKPDEEVYLYNAAAGRLACASCNPTGAQPVGIARQGEVGVAAYIPGWTAFRLSKSVYQSRYLSDSGRLFFDSNDALVPQDVNGTWDVYEYEPPGVGNCTSANAAFSERSGGCVDLLSSGDSPQESLFVDSSESGGDVFFLTTAKLAPQDFDTSYDIYDAHECTGVSPCLASPPQLPPPCENGDACKPPPSPQPAVYAAPASSTFAGSGNIAQPAQAQSTPRSSTRARGLARALRACHRKPRRRRAGCERDARARYAARRADRSAVPRPAGSGVRRGGGR